jgi:hypothetical protein
MGNTFGPKGEILVGPWRHRAVTDSANICTTWGVLYPQYYLLDVPRGYSWRTATSPSAPIVSAKLQCVSYPTVFAQGHAYASEGTGCWSRDLSANGRRTSPSLRSRLSFRQAQALPAQNGQLMLKRNKLDFERGKAAKAENEDRYNGRENRHHDRYGTAGSGKSPASLSSTEVLSKDRLFWSRHFHDDKLRAQALERGAICYLSKPFDGKTLSRCLKTALQD